MKNINKLVIATLIPYFNQQYFDYFNENYNVEITEDTSRDDIGLALFTGGSDVNPDLYNENVGDSTYVDNKRDTLEVEFFNSLDKKLLKIGICRGGQFLTVMNNGKLIQHVTGHGNDHNITIGNKIVNSTSTHHQMMYPFNLDKSEYNIIGKSTDYISEKYLNGDNKNIELSEDFVEPEIVYYKNNNCLCIQGHPEYNHASLEFKELTHNLITNELQK